jgi:hypothetical protein
MITGVPALAAAVRAALAPGWAEVVRAKKALLEILADGAPHGIRALQACLLDDNAIPAEGGHRERIQLASANDIDHV